MKYAFDNDTRSVEIKINIHFSNNEILTLTKENYLISCSILEELSSSDDSPLGAVSSNELEFEIYNENDMFTPTNESSPLYGKIKTDLKVDISIREELTEGKWINMGVYYITDWKCYQSSMSAIVTCADKMQSIINASTPNLLTRRNISVRNFLDIVFKNFGLTSSEFNIDKSLDYQMLNYAYLHSKNLGEVLNEIAKSHLCYMYMDRENILRVVSMLNFKKNALATWSDDNQIIEPRIESSILHKYTSVIVKYLDRYIGDIENISTLSNLNISNGEYSLDTINVSDPIYDLSGVTCESSLPIYVKSMSHSTNEVDIILENENELQENVKITLSGRTIKENSTLSIEKHISNIKNDKPLTISSDYLDNKDVAVKVCEMMFNYISEDIPFVELLVRGNPELQVGDVINIHDDTNKIEGEYIIISQNFSFNDSLESTVKCLNTSILKRGYLA